MTLNFPYILGLLTMAGACFGWGGERARIAWLIATCALVLYMGWNGMGPERYL